MKALRDTIVRFLESQPPFTIWMVTEVDEQGKIKAKNDNWLDEINRVRIMAQALGFELRTMNPHVHSLYYPQCMDGAILYRVSLGDIERHLRSLSKPKLSITPATLAELLSEVYCQGHVDGRPALRVDGEGMTEYLQDIIRSVSMNEALAAKAVEILGKWKDSPPERSNNGS